MFWTKVEKEQLKRAYRARMSQAISGLEAMDISGLSQVYCAVATEDRELIRSGGRAIGMVMEGMTMRQVIRLSEHFRQYTSMEWDIDWKNVDIRQKKDWFRSDRDYFWILALGSFHPNGYYRQACLEEMAGYPGALPFLVLRLNDWVGEVRLAAARAAAKCLETCPLDEVFAAMMALDKVKRSGRKDGRAVEHIGTIMAERLDQEAGSLSVPSVLSMDYEVRKSIYRFLFSGRRLDQETAELFLNQEKHSYCQSVIWTGLLTYYPCSMEMADCYLLHRSSFVRRKAMEYKYHVLKCAWPGVEDLLLDANCGIRDLAAYILKKHSQLDILAFYEKHLKEPVPVPAILGIGEQGRALDDRHGLADLVLPYLEHESEKVVRGALEAVGMLMGAEGEEIYWKYLLDTRPCISKAAYQCIRKNGIHPGAALLYGEQEKWRKSDETAGKSPDSVCHIRRYLILLLIQENSWDRLPYLIFLLKDESLKEYRDKLLGALQIRSLYARVDRKQAAFIKQVLAEEAEAVPEELARAIVFDLKFMV